MIWCHGVWRERVLARGQVSLGTEGVCGCDGSEWGLQGSGNSSEGLQYGMRAVGGRWGLGFGVSLPARRCLALTGAGGRRLA